MRILVLNGSPKGKNSITLQTIEYLKILYPAHEWETLHVGQKIRALEKDFAPAAEALARAELVLFSYPVYTFIAPAQLHRFIELMKEHAVDMRGKWASQISTSKHFYDVTAHRYVMENAQDMGMKFVRGLSADMDDLTCPCSRSRRMSLSRRWGTPTPSVSEQARCQLPRGGSLWAGRRRGMWSSSPTAGRRIPSWPR